MENLEQTISSHSPHSSEKSKHKERKAQHRYNENEGSNLLVRKFSIFEAKQSKEAINSIQNVADICQFATLDKSRADKDQSETTTIGRALDLESIEKLAVSENHFCTTCQILLSDRAEQIEHYKCDVHLFNIKQKLKGKPTVTVEEFEILSDISSISGSDSEGDESNSSSSENEDKNEVRKKPVKTPKIAFKLKDDTVLVVQRCILHSKREVIEGEDQLLNRLRAVSSTDCWAIILVGAGHFGAAIFKGRILILCCLFRDEVVVHKTFHRYVVRAKRGTVQSQHDKMSHAKSAGANIRRSQEAAFKDDIRTLIGCTWKSELEKCSCIFIRVASYNRSVLISSNSKPHTTTPACASVTSTAPFNKTDVRLRNIPFMTWRPTFNEVKRAHTLLTRLEIFKSEYLNKALKYQATLQNLEHASSFPKTPRQVKASPTASSNKPAKKHRKAKKTESESDDNTTDQPEEISESESESESQLIAKSKEIPAGSKDFIQHLIGEELKLFNEIYTACSTNNPTKLKQLLNPTSDSQYVQSDLDKETHSILIEKLLGKRLNKQKGFSLLHKTSELGHSECVWLLLVNGADPAMRDLTKKSEVAYNLGANKGTKDQFRRFMNDYPDRYDYEAAKVPGPLTEEQMNSKSEKEKEKKKAQKLKKKQREKEEKSSEKLMEIEMAERERFLALSDQEKRRLVINRNFLNVSPVAATSKEYESKLSKEQRERLEIIEKRQAFYNQSAPSASTEPAKALPDIKIISRCWQCAVDLSTQTPFEYLDYKFCSSKCLSAHRQKGKK